TDVLEAEIPPRKRACFTTLAPGLEIEESSAAGAARQPGPALEADLRCDRVEGMDYEITDNWDEIVEAMMEIAPITLDRPFHRHTVMLLYRDATYARRAWVGSEDRSAAIEAHVRTLEAHTDAKFESVDRGFVASVGGGGGGGVDCYGGVNVGNDCGMTVVNICEDLVITDTGT
nr:hypothetical protein [Tanacetum cinerariifolium]